MFDDKGGKGGLGKSDFCDKGEGGSRIPQISMTSLKDNPILLLFLISSKLISSIKKDLMPICFLSFVPENFLSKNFAHAKMGLFPDRP